MKNIIYQPLAKFITALEAGGRPRGGGTTSGDIVSLGAEHLNDAGGFDFENLKYIPQDYFEGMNKGIIQKDDILIVKDGATTGKVAIVREGFPYKIAAVNEHLFILRIKKDKLEPNFLFYFLFSGIGQSLIMRGFHGSAQGGITKSFIDNIRIPVLDLSVQRKIASILEKAESTKQKRQEAIRLTNEFLKSAFIEMFGDPIKNESHWEIPFLGDLVEFLDHQRIPVTKKDRKSGPFPYYGASGVVDWVEGYIFDEPLLLLAEDGENLRSRVKPVAFCIDGKTWVNNHAHVLRCTRVNRYFLEMLLNMIDYSSYFAGATRPKITKTTAQNIKIILPPKEEQQKFADLVQKIEALKTKQRQSEQELNNLFNSLMQKAFRGELG